MTDDILALLEDGPHSETELAAWLEQPPSLVSFALKGLKRSREVKRVGLMVWALASYEAPALGGLNQTFVEKKQRIVDSFQRGRIKPARAFDDVVAEKVRMRKPAPEYVDIAAPFTKVCPLCGADFTPRSNRQRICVGCRLKNPHRGVEEVRRGPAPPGKGWKLRPCQGCKKPILSNGPKTRCPDCLLTASQARMRSRLEERRQREAETTERLMKIEESAPLGNCVCERCGTRFTRREGTSGRFCSRDCYERGVAPAAVTHTIDGQDYDVVFSGGDELTAAHDGGSSLGDTNFEVMVTGPRHRGPMPKAP